MPRLTARHFSQKRKGIPLRFYISSARLGAPSAAPLSGDGGEIRSRHSARGQGCGAKTGLFRRAPPHPSGRFKGKALLQFFLRRCQKIFLRQRRLVAQNAKAAGSLPYRFRQHPQFCSVQISAVVHVFAGRIAQKERVFLRDTDAHAVVGVRRFGAEQLCRYSAEIELLFRFRVADIFPCRES